MRKAERTIVNDLAGSTDEGEEADKTEEGEPPKKKKRSADKEKVVTSNTETERKRKPLKEIQVGLHGYSSW